jgi:hypothetical protein
MTENLSALLSKKTLTSTQRVRLLREANRLLHQSLNCFNALQNACETAAEELNNETLSSKEQDRVDRLEATIEKLDRLTEALDLLDIPSVGEVW